MRAFVCTLALVCGFLLLLLVGCTSEESRNPLDYEHEAPPNPRAGPSASATKPAVEDWVTLEHDAIIDTKAGGFEFHDNEPMVFSCLSGDTNLVWESPPMVMDPTRDLATEPQAGAFMVHEASAFMGAHALMEGRDGGGGWTTLKVVNKAQRVVFTIHEECDGHAGDVARDFCEPRINPADDCVDELIQSYDGPLTPTAEASEAFFQEGGAGNGFPLIGVWWCLVCNLEVSDGPAPAALGKELIELRCTGHAEGGSITFRAR